MYDKAAFIAVCCTAYNLKPTSMNDFIGFKNAIAKANFPRCANCFGLRASFTLGAIPLFWLHVIRAHLWYQWEISFLPRISQIFTDLVTCYPCPFVLSVGNIFPPTDFTDLHGFGYMLSVFICVISGKYLSSHGFHGFSQIWLHVIRAHLWHQWEYFFLLRISLICTDLIINYPWVLCLWVK